MTSISQTLVNFNGTAIAQGTPGNSNTANLQSMFPSSPIYLGDISDNERRDSFDEISQDTFSTTAGFNDLADITGYYGINYSYNYVNAPDLNNVDLATHNLPSPYMPNPTSPGQGNGANHTSKPAFTGQVKNVNTVNNFGSGLGGLVSPSDTSPNISQLKLGDFISGNSFQGSGGN